MAPTPGYWTQIFPGQLFFIFTLAALLAFPISFLLLRLYRHAILKSMDRRAGTAEDLPRAGEAPAPISSKPAAPLQIITLPQTDVFPLAPEAQGSYDRAVRAPWRIAAVYALGGTVFAVIMALANLVSGEIQISTVRILALSWNYMWPIPLILGLIVGSRARTRLLLVLVYFCLYGILGAVMVMRNPGKYDFEQHFIMWVLMSIPATGLFLAYLSRRVRAVGSLVFMVMLLACTGLVFFHPLLRRFVYLPLNLSFHNQLLASLQFSVSLVFGVLEGSLLRQVAETLLSLGNRFPTLVSYKINPRDLSGFAIFGILGWLLVQWVRARYEQKKISDQSLALDSFWLLLGMVYALPALFEQRQRWVISGFIAFLAYKVATMIGFAVAKGPGGGPGVKLLLLRVFALGKRSEKLFDDFGAHWRYIGPIQMIAGPDLATTTIEPHEFLQFLRGKLSRRFIDGQETLNQRISQMDLKPDRDWRYRVNDFFCFADTWKMVLDRLVQESDAVLMDLRNFNRERSGCIFEIKEIINRVSLDRAVFIIDATTDEPYLRQVVVEAWEGLRPASPNYNSASPRLSLFHYTGAASHHQLLRAVCAAARPV